tara:strand:- start:23623 stop:24711 length:1089 start_codon:yes stop_codon:yes gene_type:complete
MIKFLELTNFDNDLDNDIHYAFKKVFEKGIFVNGDNVDNFENNFKTVSNSNYCVSCGNGMDALTIILKSLNLKQNSKVLVPAQTFIATYLSIIAAGCIPIPVDVNEDTCLLSLEDAKKRISDDTTAMVFVNLFGFGISHDEAQKFCNYHNIKLIYDSAQSHLTTFDDVFLTSYGSHAVSFYPGKNLGAYGDGGAILTNDENIHAFAKKYRNYGSKEKYNHEIIGVNSRLDELQAAFLNEKLKRLPDWTEKRREQANIYLQNINNKKIKLPKIDKKLNPSWHLFPIRVYKRKLFQEYMNQKNIQTLIHYPKLPINSLALESFEYNSESFKNAQDWENNEVSIPIGPHLNEIQIMKIVDAINKF